MILIARIQNIHSNFVEKNTFDIPNKHTLFQGLHFIEPWFEISYKLNFLPKRHQRIHFYELDVPRVSAIIMLDFYIEGRPSPLMNKSEPTPLSLINDF